MSERRRRAFLVLGTVFTAILLSAGVASAEIVFAHKKVYLSYWSYPVDVKATGELIATANNAAHSVSITRRNPDGTYTPHEDYPVAGNYPVSLVFLDANEDGKKDVATADSAAFGGSHGISLLLNDGEDAFLPARVPYVGYFAIYDVDAAQLNSKVDSHEDLVAISQYPALVVLNGDGQGGFTKAVELDVPYLNSVTTAKLNEDPYTDLVATRIAIVLCDDPERACSDILAWYGNGSGGFEPAQVIARIPEVDLTRADVGDFNDDSLPDVAAITSGRQFPGNPGNLRVELNNGDGTFTESDAVLVGPEDSEATDLQAVEIEGKRKLGITIFGDYDEDIGAPVEDRVTIADVEEDGTISGTQDILMGYSGPAGIDTAPDKIFVANFEDHSVSVLEKPQCSDGADNDGDGKTDFGSATGDPGCESSEDDDEVGTPELSISDTRVTEGDSGPTDAVFTVTRSGDTGGASSVAFDTEDGTATAPGDYEETSDSLTFASGEASKEIRVPVKGDTQDEPNEDFFVNLTDPTGATILDERGKGTISDDDEPENAPPVAASDSYIIKGKTLSVKAPGVLKNDSDPNSGDTLVAKLLRRPSKGTLTLDTDGSFVYTPSKAFKKGTDSFTYRVSDGKGGTDQATVTLSKAKKKK